jgi:hypothetical protein
VICGNVEVKIWVEKTVEVAVVVDGVITEKGVTATI